MSIISTVRKLKSLVIGKAKDPSSSSIFHKLSLIAFFAWIGLGADGLSSACYGPEEAFRSLQGHPQLALIVALASAFTIFVIGTSYSQIVELFPSGGGGYVVGTKLLNPTFGMVSGCALLIDYVLTIALSVASGTDAVFSMFPVDYQSYKTSFAIIGVIVLTVLNMRGVKESVITILPVFLIFLITHASGIIYAFITHLMNFSFVASSTVADFKMSSSQIGIFGVLALILRSYSMGAGTYTGIEAVSNGMNILREPKVQTAKRTMLYMMFSLSFMVVGLMFAYVFYNVQPQEGKTLNAILFDTIFGNSNTGKFLLILTLFSEAAILFVAAQTGFLGGPGVMASMAMDRWFPTRFTALSDRLVTQNGILAMGLSAVLLLFFTHASVQYLIVLYSINVFITFVLSQAGMVKHWWSSRKENIKWKWKLFINGVGLLLTSFILFTVVVIKFFEGGWITMFITGALIALVIVIKAHYKHTATMLKRLDALVHGIKVEVIEQKPVPEIPFNTKAKTAILLVNGFNGLGLHTLFNIFRLFKDTFKNFVIIQVGVVDAGVFKGSKEVSNLEHHIKKEIDQYVHYIQSRGFYAEGIALVGVDVVHEIVEIAPVIMKKYPDAVFFGGQLVMPEESLLSRWLHNYTVFTIQRKFYYTGIPVVLLPIRL